MVTETVETKYGSEERVPGERTALSNRTAREASLRRQLRNRVCICFVHHCVPRSSLA